MKRRIIHAPLKALKQRERPAKCANTQLALFNYSVREHDAADDVSLCLNHVGKARCTMLERKKEQQTYPQRWHEYNLSQTREKAYFLELLHQLCALIEEPVRRKGKGRPAAPLADLVFAACLKVYCCMSGRRNQSDLDEALRRGYLSRSVRYNTMFKYLELESLTPTLRRLITESALPLKAVEVDFAVDSSGFSTRRFVRWYSEKYGSGKKDTHDWLKLHAMVGVTTHVITTVEISERNSHDNNYFDPLLINTARYFNLREVAADKAYANRVNLHLVESVGAKPYIAFRSNTRGDTKNSTWNRIFHYTVSIVKNTCSAIIREATRNLPSA